MNATPQEVRARLARPLEPTADLDAILRSRASAFRGLVKACEDAGVLPQMLEVVSERAREHLTRPPLGLAWMPGLVFQEAIVAIDAVAGRETLVKVANASMHAGPMQHMRPFIEGTLRLFGATPHAFYRRLPKMLEGQLIGMTFAYEPKGPDGAIVSIEHGPIRDVDDASFAYWQGVLQVSVELCRRTLKRTAYERDLGAPRNSGRVVIEWAA